jgi:hypothetical protein
MLEIVLLIVFTPIAAVIVLYAVALLWPVLLWLACALATLVFVIAIGKNTSGYTAPNPYDQFNMPAHTASAAGAGWTTGIAIIAVFAIVGCAIYFDWRRISN